MAAPGKKTKGKKRVTLALNEFLANTENTSTTTTSRLVPRKSGNWADECEDDDVMYRQKLVLPSGPRATWGPDIDDNKIPKSPPYLAFISNLPYEVEEDEIEEFFKDLKILGVRLPRDDRPGKLRGFGYVEFETRNCLISALSLPDTTIKGRRIRIEVAAENDRRRGRDGMRDRGYDSERSGGDWRSGPREGPLGEAERRGTSFMSRDRDGFDRSGPRREFGFRDGFDRDRGGFRDGDRGGFRDGDRGGFRDGDRGGFRDGDRGGFRDGDRGGFRDGDRGGFRDGDRGGFRDGDRGGFRDGDRGGFRDGDRGGFRDGDRGGFRDAGRDGERERGWERDSFRDGDRGRFGDRDGFGPRRDFGGGRDRDSFRSEGRDELPPPDKAGEPRARPRLNLQPRSKPVEETSAPAPASSAPTSSAPASVPAPTPAPAAPASGAPASIFGGARPVDTAARERIIEERLARERGDREVQRSEKNDEGRYKDGDSARPPTRRVDSNAPARENFWSQRSRQNGPPSDSGRASPHSDHSERDSKQDPEEAREYRNRPESPEGQFSSRDRQHGGRSGSQRSAYEHDEREDQQSYDGEERDQAGPRGGSSSERVPPPQPRGNDKDQPKGRDSRIDRDRREGKDEQISMPKYHEQEAPNFAGSNKFAYLHDEDHE